MAQIKVRRDVPTLSYPTALPGGVTVSLGRDPRYAEREIDNVLLRRMFEAVHRAVEYDETPGDLEAMQAVEELLVFILDEST